MARRILFPLLWLTALFLVVHALWSGGWALVIPGAVAAAGLLFGLDLRSHRSMVALDRDLVQTALLLLSAVALASGCLYWLLRLLAAGRAQIG